MRRLALTTWSLHRKLGSPPMIALPDEDSGSASQAELELTDVPQCMQEYGIGTLEICHFHFPSASPDYLRTLRTAIEAAGVELFSVLIDTGDISHPDPRRCEADIRLIERWMEIAAELGARAVRVVAGEAAPDDEAALRRAITGLEHLAGRGRELGLQVLTENFRPLASTAANCIHILDALDGEVGLCADVGNFPDASRVPEFKAVVGRASSVHAKASYNADGRMDPRQLRECLAASVDAGFDGPYTLVYDRPGDAWKGIVDLREVVSPYLQ